MTFYLMHRGWMDNPTLQDRTPQPYTKREAWQWLIENAAFKTTRVRAGITVIDLERGQLTISLRLLGKKWLWDHLKVKRFLKKLIVAGMIEVCRGTDTPSETGQTIITVCNYNKYQNGFGLTETPSETEMKQQRNSNETPIKQDKEGYQESTSPSLRSGEGVERPPPTIAPNPESARDIAERMVSIWREEMDGFGLRMPSKLTPDRIKAAAARWHDSFHDDAEEWRSYLANIRASPFLLGSKGWAADFDWALRPKSILGVIEGKYTTSSNLEESSNGKQKLTPAAKLFIGGRLAADQLDFEDTEREAREGGSGQSPALTLLDGGRSNPTPPSADRRLVRRPS